MIYNETQKFRQWWLWLILAGSAIALPGMIIRDYVQKGEQLLQPPVLITTLVITGILLLFRSLQLTTRVDEQGVAFRFSPLIMNEKRWNWNEISRAYIRQYSPIADFGGWGIRVISFGKGSAYNVSGNIGLQLEMKNGKKILIGTGRKDEMQQALINLKKQYGIEAIETEMHGR